MGHLGLHTVYQSRIKMGHKFDMPALKNGHALRMFMNMVWGENLDLRKRK
jgi:hypothetical protein